jgi:hypothetical protein
MNAWWTSLLVECYQLREASALLGLRCMTLTIEHTDGSVVVIDVLDRDTSADQPMCESNQPSTRCGCSLE